MSSCLGQLAITANTPVTFDAPNDGVKAILIGNESGLTVTVTMESGGVQKTLYPSSLDWFAVNKGFTGKIKITPTAILNNTSTFPASSLIFDAIGIQDSEQASMYPISFVRTTNTGNVVTTAMGGATSLQNDGNAASTVFVEATPTGDASSAVTLTTGGALVLGNGTHTGSISSDNGKVATNGSGTMTVTKLSSDAGKVVTNGSGTMTLASALNPATTPPGSGNFVNSIDFLNGSQIGLFGGSGGVDVQINTNSRIQLGVGGSAKLVAKAAGCYVGGTLEVSSSASIDGGTIVTNGSGSITLVGATLTGPANINLTPLTVNGQTSGHADIYQYMQGTVKRVIIHFVNYRNTANQTVTLPVAFTDRALIWTGEQQALQLSFLLSGVAQSIKIVTGLALAGGAQSAQTFIKQWSMGQIDGSGFDTIQFGTGIVNPINGVAIIEGF